MPSIASLAVCCSLVELAVSLPAPWGSWWPHKGHGKGSGGINVQLGPRPYYLVDNMDEGDLKDKLESCSEVCTFGMMLNSVSAAQSDTSCRVRYPLKSISKTLRWRYFILQIDYLAQSTLKRSF